MRDSEFTEFKVVVSMLCIAGALLCLSVYSLNLRMAALEEAHRDCQVEDVFLGRKMEELKKLTENEVATAHLHVDLAVSGFRTGSYRKYQMILAEARSTGVLQEGVQGVQR
jgi:hypothetical protein